MPPAGPLNPIVPIKPIVLHLGEPITHNKDFYSRLQSQFDFINPPVSDLKRSAFISNLRDRKWGDFSAIMRPFWNTGGEMGKWDGEIIELLPKTVKVYASAGAGYDWVDTHALADHGMRRLLETLSTFFLHLRHKGLSRHSCWTKMSFDLGFHSG